MKNFIFIAVLIFVCGQTAVDVQADVVDCAFADKYIRTSSWQKFYTCEITSTKLSRHQNIVTGDHEFGKYDDDVMSVSLPNSFINFTELDSTFCQLFPNLGRIDFTFIRQVILRPNALHECLNLQYFKLANAGIKEIPSIFFSNNFKLTFLSLNRNRLETLPEDSFSSLKDLEQLDLSWNQLTHLHENIFSAQIKLEELMLHNNNLSILSHCFDNLKNLEILNLSGNKIENLPKDIFVGMERLKELELASNSLTTIHADSFSVRQRLRRVSLQGNKIVSIDENFIEKIVDELDLWGNVCHHERIGEPLENKKKLQECFDNYQPRKQQALTVASAKSCGAAKTGTENITNGSPIQAHSFPWIAAITDSEGKYLCGGTIVTDQKIVTAAHCLQDKNENSSRQARDIKVLLGPHDLNERFPDALKVGIVQKTHIHHDWNSSSKRFDADIAVLVLVSKILFNDYIQPVCLLEDEQSPARSINTSIVVGYSKSDDDDKTNEIIPKVIGVPIVTNEDCIYDDQRVLILSSRRTFCGGYRNGTGVCKSEGGNGLLVRHNDVYYLRGIAAAAVKNRQQVCNVNTYSVFTEVHEYIEWINGVSVDLLD